MPAFLAFAQAEYPDVQTQDEVVFGASTLSDGTAINRVMAVYAPVGDSATGRPALLFLHGNPGQAAYPDGRHHRFRSLMEHFARRGYVCFGIAWDLRQGHEESFGPIEMAVIHVREHAETYGVAQNRIGVIGASYGARHACTLATANFVDNRAKVQACIMMAGGMSYPQDCDESDAPILLDYGTGDSWFVQVPGILEALKRGNVPHAYFELEDGGHVLPVETPLAYGKTKLDLMEAFLAIHLRDDDTDLKTLTFACQGEGTVVVGEGPSYGLYPKGHKVSLIASPEAGCRFVAWIGDVESSSPRVIVEMDDNKRVVAIFEQAEYFK